jgi:hypothetical protein
MVAIKCLVLNLKMPVATDVPEKDNQEPMADQVISMEPELSLCLFVQCCSHFFYGNLY